MEKEKRITAPDGCEIAKVELVNGVAVVTFKKKDRFLPKSWEDFCSIFPLSENEVSIDPEDCTVYGRYSPSSDRTPSDCQSDILTFSDCATAEAFLALCQLLQLRDFYNGGWVPDWTDGEKRYTLDFYEGKIWGGEVINTPEILHFKSRELRDEFLLNFRPLIEKLKPLYGIKKGGNE